MSGAADTPDRAALAVEEVSKSYGSLKALDTLSIAVARGEFVALLGPNGAGKSTLFQLLTGLFVPDEGRIEVAGHDMRHESRAALAKLGVVFQQPTLDLDLSVAANLRFHTRLHGMGRAAKRRIDDELARIGLAERSREAARNLSGGNRRKVELARALLHDPALLLMDEPTVGLDPGSRELLVDYVHQLCRDRGMGVLWATHLVDEAERAHRVIVLHQGQRIAVDTPAALRERAGTNSLGAAFMALTGETPQKKEETV
ncbi:ABC transporter ATP-binding protein [Salinisphaera orenii]|uniref:ABC transporter ATP-binding protein n=1 Tax=Salinisphaera orenii YIM 95161 TaxID=1051139 RepID=A0A423PPR9_9GAMM|nr:ABC transporter ATP-binding protein [Salinisphaera halophila]ROO27542.1 ABC transporter ATP-binding protein [Salinisphaera halophila YIM 95161]